MLALCLGAPPSFAQNAADRATARALAEQGHAALEAGQYSVAEDRFRRADELVHAPTIVVDHGRALMELGRCVEAQERFELVLREGVDDDAPEPWKRAVENAGTLLEAVRPKVAWLTVIVPGLRDPSVTVDGAPLPRAAIGVRRATDPGVRTIEVSAQGYKARTLSVELREGDQRSVQLVLGKLPAGETAEPRPAAPAAEDSPRSPLRETTNSTLTYVALGVGATGIAVGSVTGFLALRKRSDLDLVCTDGVCPPGAESDLSSYNTLGYISGISFAVGVAGTVVGVVRLLGASDSSPAEPTSRPAVALELGPTHLGVHGVF